MSDLVIRLRILVVRIAFAVARFLPLRRRVVLATAHDATLRGNLRVIGDALRAADPPVAVTVLAHASRGDLRGKVRSVWQAALAGYHLATARVFIVDDYFFPVYAIRPRPGTTIVQTWHASGAFKKFGLSVLDKSFGATEALTRRVRIHANYDVCLIGSRAGAVFYAEALGQPVERFRPDLGIPRTDALFDPEAIARTTASVHARYGIAPGKRVILYAPTFRGDSVGAAVAGPMLDLPLLRAALGADHVLLLRLHPFVRAGLDIPPSVADFAIDVSDHPDINDLLLASDILVTDYSSVIFEFALLRRPMVFFAPDLDDYEGERGFYFDYRTGVPGPVFTTSAEIADYLQSRTVDIERIDAFRAWAFEVADGHATQRFLDQIVRPALDGRLETGRGSRA